MQSLTISMAGPSDAIFFWFFFIDLGSLERRVQRKFEGKKPIE